MRPGLRLGRIGPLTINLHYTWIFAAILVLWWVALQWLPENFPSWAPNFYWLVAVAVVLLYVVCVVLHEVVHAAVARTAPHHVTLFPFGAAAPFQVHDMTLVRAITAALAAPVFNLVLGARFGARRRSAEEPGQFACLAGGCTGTVGVDKHLGGVDKSDSGHSV